jgi:hypothetical protein
MHFVCMLSIFPANVPILQCKFQENYKVLFMGLEAVIIVSKD